MKMGISGNLSRMYCISDWQLSTVNFFEEIYGPR